MKSKTNLLFFAFILLLSVPKRAEAQQTKISGPSDTLVVVWASGDPDVAEKSCLMYASAAKRFKWFDQVILVVWGPSEKLLAENETLKAKVASMKESGITVQACVACANMYGVADSLKVCKVDVIGMGVPLTRYLKRGYKVISY